MEALPVSQTRTEWRLKQLERWVRLGYALLLALFLLILWFVVRGARAEQLCPDVASLEQGLTLPRGVALPKLVLWHNSVWQGYYLGSTQRGCDYVVHLRVRKVR